MFDVYKFNRITKSKWNERNKDSVSGYGSIIGVDAESLDRAKLILSHVPDGFYKAVGSALKRTASSGLTVAKRSISKEYTLSQSQVLEHTKFVNHFVRDDGTTIEVAFGYQGYVIPLIRFDTTVSNEGIQTRVYRSSSKDPLTKAFVAQTGHGHIGVYERVGEKRKPMRELFGPSTPQIIGSMESRDKSSIEKTMAETYEKRIDHEIDRILKGYGM